MRSKGAVEATGRFERWLFDAALPLWWEAGADFQSGGFHEALEHDGRPVTAARRLRVQARQVYVYATAGTLGWPGPWARAVEHGLAYLRSAYRRSDGLLRKTVTPDGAPEDDTADLYDQAFGLLALAQAHRATLDASLITEASSLLAATREAFAHGGGGFREAAARPYQANPQMHLLEAALAWAEQDVSAMWRATADELATLALRRFIDSKSGALREFFDAAWNPAPGLAGRLVEPGHQFEWSWLLERWGRWRERPDARSAARRLFEIGGDHGVDRRRNVAVNVLLDDMTVHDPAARLWPQTERIKAAAILATAAAAPAERDALADEAAAALRGLMQYLNVPLPGLWRDKLAADGTFLQEPAPASSFYHIIGAAAELRRHERSTALPDDPARP